MEIGIILLSDIRTDPVTGRPFPDHHPAGGIAGLRKAGRTRSQRSRTRSPRGWEQQISALPPAGSSTGSGL